jgi:hypothetical protein
VRVSLISVALAIVGACTPGPPNPLVPFQTRASCSGADSDSLLSVKRAARDSLNEPRMLRAGRQIFPAEVRQSGEDGWIRVEFLVAPDGTVDPCRVRVLGYSHSAFIDPGVAMLLDSEFAAPEHQTYMQLTINWRVLGNGP